MLTLILATHNENKRKEMAAMLQNLPIHVLSLNDYPDIGEIVENGKTFADNAAIKAQTVANLTGQLALADDSGLEVDALDGAPGIYSARFAGLDHDDAANNALLLEKMAAVPEEKRQAHFTCVMALALPDEKPIFVRGQLDGVILHQAAGSGGFGYDPLFFVPTHMKSLAEMSAEEKNAISHRGRACAKVIPLLEAYADGGQVPRG